jgi:hypothetical protein
MLLLAVAAQLPLLARASADEHEEHEEEGEEELFPPASKPRVEAEEEVEKAPAAYVERKVEGEEVSKEEVEGEEGGEEVEELEEFEDIVAALGSVAFYLGLLLNLGFVAFRWSRALGLNPSPQLARIVMEIHMDGNLVLGGLAGIHGLLSIGHATLLEYVLGVLLATVLASGLAMRYLRYRQAKVVARVVHVQRALALLLLALVLVHVAARE